MKYTGRRQNDFSVRGWSYRSQPPALPSPPKTSRQLAAAPLAYGLADTAAPPASCRRCRALRGPASAASALPTARTGNHRFGC